MLEALLVIVSFGLFVLGLLRFVMFRRRLKKYTKTKATITNYDIETRFFSSSGIETDRDQYERFKGIANWKKVGYYSPVLTYHADDDEDYQGTWWIEMPICTTRR